MLSSLFASGRRQPTLPHLQYHQHKRISLLCSEWEEVEQRYHRHLIISRFSYFTLLKNSNQMTFPIPILGESRELAFLSFLQLEFHLKHS